MVNLDDLTMLNDLKARLLLVTERQVQFAANRLGPVEENDTVVGEVSVVSQYLWTLVGILAAEVSLEQAKAIALEDDVTVADHEERSNVANQLKDIAMELAWAQARCDTGYWKSKSVGLREGWVLVQSKEDKSPAGLLARLGLPMPPR